MSITCVHKRIAELEGQTEYLSQPPWFTQLYPITRTPERTAEGARIIRYKLAR